MKALKIFMEMALGVMLAAGLVACGGGGSGGGGSVVVYPSGTLDTTFGTNGVVAYNNSSLLYNGNPISFQPQMTISAGEKILMTRYPWGSSRDLLLLRFNTDGTLDTTFGTNGIAFHDSGGDERGFDVAIQVDGKILVTGDAQDPNIDGGYQRLLLVRFNSNGTLDTTFGANGVAEYAGSVYNVGHNVSLQPDGKILVAGSMSTDGVDEDILLVRFNANGTLDTTFGVNGAAAYNNSGWQDEPMGLTVQADGNVILVSRSWGTDERMLLVRFNANGTLDTTFGSNGTTVYAPIGSISFDVTGPALQSDGKILVASTSTDFINYEVLLLRYNANGTLDTTYGINGAAIFYHGGYYTAINRLVLQSDGKALVTGHIWNGTDPDLVLQRYNADGTIDITFGTNSVVTYDNGGMEMGYNIRLLSDGKALVAGYTSFSGDLILLRFE
jgi:uncharacterized delta-60 repeat protein